MILEGVAIQGFRSFLDEEVLKAPNVPGLYLISAPNGTGKTSFLEAICWAFFGQTSTGQRAKAVHNWSGDKLTIVNVDMRRPDGELVALDRHWNPNSLILQIGEGVTQKITQEVVDDLLGMTYDQFLAAVYFSQRGTPWMQLGGAAQLRALSAVLGLDAWEQRSQKAKGYACEVDSQCAAWLDKIELCQHRRTTTHATYDEIFENYQLYDNGVSQNIDDAEVEAAQLKVEHLTLIVDLPVLESDLYHHEKDVETFKRARAKARKRLLELNDLRDTARQEVHACSQNTTSSASHAANTSLMDAQDTVKECERRVHAVSGGRCPLCGVETYDDEDDEDDDGDAQKELDVAEEIVCRAKAHLDREREKDDLEKQGHRLNVEDNLESVNADKRITEKNIADDTETIETCLQHAATARARLKVEVEKEIELCRKRKAHKTRIQKLKTQDNPYEGRVNRLEEQMREAKKELKQHRKQLRAAEKLAGYWRFLAKHYLMIRLEVLDEAACEFETLMNSALNALNRSGWSARVATTKTLSTGEERAEFSIMVQSPDSPELSDIRTWSGGEGQMLTVAGSSAYCDLVCGRLSSKPEFEFWDEPSHHLDDDALVDLMTFLKARARSTGKQIWVIDHNSKFCGEFDATWQFTRDERGTHIGAMT